MVQERREPLLFPLLLALAARVSQRLWSIARSCARRVLCWSAFPLVAVLGSTGSAADRSALFVGFPATTTESDSSGPCIIGYDSSSSLMRAGGVHPPAKPGDLPVQKSVSAMPVSMTTPGRTALAITRLPYCLPRYQARRLPDRRTFRGSMAGLCAPLSTLRRHPREYRRMTRGQCGSLDLHCKRLALSTLCRSPGALAGTLIAERPVRRSERAHSATALPWVFDGQSAFGQGYDTRLGGEILAQSSPSAATPGGPSGR